MIGVGKAIESIARNETSIRYGTKLIALARRLDSSTCILSTPGRVVGMRFVRCVR